MKRTEKRKRGRPVEKPMAEPIDDDPEDVARTLLFSKPRKRGEWKYLKEVSPPAILQQQDM